MKSLAYKTAFALVASLSLVVMVASSATAQSRLMLEPPGSGPGYYPPVLPQFGFSAYNIGLGERVTFVRWGGLASQLGLEPGDIIVSLNGYPLTYTGSWNDALSRAIADGGWVQLRVRDIRTGRLAFRQTFVGGSYGPVDHYYAGSAPYSVQYRNSIPPRSTGIGTAVRITRTP